MKKIDFIVLVIITLILILAIYNLFTSKILLYTFILFLFFTNLFLMIYFKCKPSFIKESTFEKYRSRIRTSFMVIMVLLLWTLVNPKYFLLLTRLPFQEKTIFNITTIIILIIFYITLFILPNKVLKKFS